MDTTNKRDGPTLKVTDEMRMEIQRLSGLGTPIRAISAIVGICQASIYKYYREDLIKGRALANSDVANALHEAALGGNVGAQIFWLKSRCGWKEGENHDDEYEPEKSRIQMVTNNLIPVGQNNE